MQMKFDSFPVNSTLTFKMASVFPIVQQLITNQSSPIVQQSNLIYLFDLLSLYDNNIPPRFQNPQVATVATAVAQYHLGITYI